MARPRNPNKILLKLTIADLVGSKTDIQKITTDAVQLPVGMELEQLDEGPDVDLAQFIGNITSMRVVPRDEGDPGVEFTGRVEGLNKLTGEVLENTKWFFPAVLANTLAAAFKDAGDNVAFAVVLTAKYKKKSVAGYTYGAYSLIEAKPSDAIQAMKAQLAAGGVKFDVPKLANNPTDPDAEASRTIEKDEPAKTVVETPAPAAQPAKKR